MEAAVGHSLAPKEEFFRINYFKGTQDDLNKYWQATYNCMQSLIEWKGLYDGRGLLKVFEDEIEKVTGDRRCTFEEFDAKSKLKGNNVKELTVVSLNLSTHLTKIFSPSTTPNVVISDAVRASMSFPYFFKPHEVKMKVSGKEFPYLEYYLDEKAEKKSFLPIYVDGGVLDNYPTWLYDKDGKGHTFFNPSTVGFKLVSKEQLNLFENGQPGKPEASSESSFLEFTTALVATVLGSEDNEHFHNGDRARTIYVDNVGVSTLDFSIETQTKDKISQSGAAGVQRFFAREGS